MITAKIFHFFLRLMLWIPLVASSLLLAHNATLYFTHGGEYGILPEKLVARQDWLWNACFYVHLPAGIICLLIPFASFAKRYIKRGVAFHRVIGNIYVWVTVLIVCPTGMYLALYAKGGLITQVGFMTQGILLIIFTWKGYTSSLHNHRLVHVYAMIRSYAVATAVLSFRVLHIMFFLLKVPYQDNYAISQWLGLSLNLLIAEIVIAYMASVRVKSFNINSKGYETV